MSNGKRGAVLQFEADRVRFDGVRRDDYSAKYNGEEPHERIRFLARTAVNDTIRHGGTFVLVVTDTKITMIQRPDADEI